MIPQTRERAIHGDKRKTKRESAKEKEIKRLEPAHFGAGQYSRKRRETERGDDSPYIDDYVY